MRNWLEHNFTYECSQCGFEFLTGHGHNTDFVICSTCGADYVVQYQGWFGSCSKSNPGTLILHDSQELKFDDRTEEKVIRSGVLPLKDSELPDLSGDRCAKCDTLGSIVISISPKMPCPKCKKGLLKNLGEWIQ